MKICSRCNTEKNENEFPHYRSQCKECFKIKTKEWNRNNYESDTKKRKELNKKYHEENKEKMREYGMKYKTDNNIILKERAKEYRKENKVKIKEYQKRRKKDDPIFKLSSSIRTLISISIKRLGYDKKSKTYEILGISFDKFKIYIESQFIENMSWENYGKWHLDHKIPISWANSEELVYELNNYSNFQPLWASDNLKKGNRYKN